MICETYTNSCFYFNGTMLFLLNILFKQTKEIVKCYYDNAMVESENNSISRYSSQVMHFHTSSHQLEVTEAKDTRTDDPLDW